MTQFAARYAHAPQEVILPNRRVSDAIRYGGVLAVWLGLTVIQPRLGLEILRSRRPDSPLRRRNRRSVPSQFAETQEIRAFSA
jgi:hypothetical protein